MIGIADDYRGQAPKAFVRLGPGSTAKPDDVKAFLGDQISKIEMPKFIELRDHLPKTSIGKLSGKGLVAEEVFRADSLPAPQIAHAVRTRPGRKKDRDVLTSSNRQGCGGLFGQTSKIAIRPSLIARYGVN